MSTSILSIRKVTKAFGGLIAVHDLDLELAEHTIHSVIGPNGAGKTTYISGHFPYLSEYPALQQPNRHRERSHRRTSAFACWHAWKHPANARHDQ